MRNNLALAAAVALLTSVPLAAEALPIAPAQTDGPTVTLVAGGCGIGMHRGPAGGCRPNGRAVIVGRPVILGRPIFVGRPIRCRIVGLIPHRVCRRW